MTHSSAAVPDSLTRLTVADIRELAKGESFTLPVLIKGARDGSGRNNSKFTTGTFGDATGEFVSTLFPDNPALGVVKANVGEAVLLSGVSDEFNRAFRPRVTYARLLTGDERQAVEGRLRFVGPIGRAALEERLAAHIAAISSPELRQAVSMLLNSRREAFFHLPAAVYHHHAYVMGLAEHTCSVVGLARQLAGPDGPYAHLGLNLDVLVAGLLIHDLGKVEEYAGVESFETTPEGRMIGHITYGALWFWQVCLACKVPKELARSVTHVVLSHHGELEYGSPVRPCTPEAIFAHNIDSLDAQMGKLYLAQHGIENDMKLVRCDLKAAPQAS